MADEEHKNENPGYIIQQLLALVLKLEGELAKVPIYKNPNCTINHPGSPCNVACGEY